MRSALRGSGSRSAPKGAQAMDFASNSRIELAEDGELAMLPLFYVMFCHNPIEFGHAHSQQCTIDDKVARTWKVLLFRPMVSALSPSPRLTVFTASQRQNMTPCPCTHKLLSAPLRAQSSTT